MSMIQTARGIIRAYRLSWSSGAISQGGCIVHAVLEFSNNKSGRVHCSCCLGILEQPVREGALFTLSWSSRAISLGGWSRDG